MSWENTLNWIADTFARVDIIDLYFVVSELIDIPISKDEMASMAYHDALSVFQAEGVTIVGRTVHLPDGSTVSLGKYVA